MPLVCNRPTSELKALVSRLGGTWSGNTAMCLCPAHADRTPSMSIRQGDRAILVTCHAGCDRSDVLRAISRITRIPRFDPEKIERTSARSGKAFLKIWREGHPIEGTLAERYVRQVRGIGGELQDLRFHPRCPKGQAPLARFEPALLVGMRRDGDLAAIQRIFLDPRTGASTAKLCLGRAIGSAWANGALGSVLGLCEGFESAAAFTHLIGIKAWASMGAKRFHQLTIPRTVERLILLADNDAEGHRAANRALVAYSQTGLAIETRWPPRGANDWADLLKR